MTRSATVPSTLGEVMNQATRFQPSGQQGNPIAAHKNLANSLLEILYRDTQTSLEDIERLTHFFLNSPKRDVTLQRGIWFFAYFIAKLLSGEDREAKDFAATYLHALLPRTKCANKTVRHRACMFIRVVMEEFADDGELEEGLADSIVEAMNERLMDKAGDVVVQAIHALYRFNSHGENDDHTVEMLNLIETSGHPATRASALQSLPKNSDTAKAVVVRTRDISDLVRCRAFGMLTEKFSPEVLSGDSRAEVIRNGLRDRSEVVRKLAGRMVVSWFSEFLENSPVRFMKLLDPERHHEECGLAIEFLLDVESLTVGGVEEMLGRGEGLRGVDRLIEPWRALFWRIVCCWLKRVGGKRGQEAAMDTGAGATIRANETLELLDALDAILPESLGELLGLIGRHVGESSTFQARQLLEIVTHCANFSDASDREAMAELVEKLCGVSGDDALTGQVVGLGKKVWVDDEVFSRRMLSVVKAFSDGWSEQGESAEKWHHWCVLVSEFLRNLPRRRGAYAWASDDFTISDLDQTLSELSVEHECSAVRAKAIEALSLYSLLNFTASMRDTVIRILTGALEHDDDFDVRQAAVSGLFDLCMSYGIRSVDGAVEPSAEENALSTIPYNVVGELSPMSLIRVFSNYGDGEDGEDLVSATGLCRLLAINEAWGALGMTKVEVVQCLTELVVLMCDGAKEDKTKLRQSLTVFFDRYAQMRPAHQQLLKSTFLPAIRQCLELPGARCGPACQSIRFLSNLLQAPVQQPSNNPPTQITQGNTQFACLLLWEIAHCPRSTASKFYTNALWKTVMELEYGEGPEVARKLLEGLARRLRAEGGIRERELENLVRKMGWGGDEVVLELEDGEIDGLVDELDGYMRGLGAHPLSTQD